MTLIQQLKPEYRSAILATRLYVEPPSKTPAHIKARMLASMTAYCEKRSITPAEERIYQSAATAAHAMPPRPVISDQTAVKKQIADWNKRQAVPTIDRRHGELALRYKALSYDQIKRAVRLNYDEDTLNALNLGELGKSLRAGVAFEASVQSPRYSGGSSEDPELKFRDESDEDKIWPEAARTKEEHEESASWHRNCARQAKTMERGVAHHQAADLHATAARLYPDLNSRFAACAASKNLRHSENCL
jgi:hypothetical protein